MKMILILTALIFFQIQARGQEKFERVNIYAISFKWRFPVANIDADFVRVNADYFFTTTDKVWIDSLFSDFFSEDHKGRNFQPEEEYGDIRMVVDFIRCGEKKAFVTIDGGYQLFFHTSSIKTYTKLFSESAFRKEFEMIPFLDLLDYK